MVVLPPLICSVLSFAIFMAKGMQLDRLSSFALISIYMAYIWFSVSAFGEDKD